MVYAKPLYVQKDRYNYQIKIKPFRKSFYLFKGWWMCRKNLIHQGPQLFYFDENLQIFRGQWLAWPRGDESVPRSGEWLIEYITNQENMYLKSYLIKSLHIFLEKLTARRSLIEGIIERHKKFNQDKFIYNDMSFKVRNHCFIPILEQEVTEYFIGYLKDRIRPTDKILDLFAGCGFFSIYLAKKMGCQMIGINDDDTLRDLCYENSKINKTEELTEFRVSRKNRPSSMVEKEERFNYIIAFPPCVQTRDAYQSRKSLYYKRLCSLPIHLEELIFGSQYYVNEDSRLIFVYSKQGYFSLLHSLIELSNWDETNIFKKTFKSGNMEYVIYDLELSRFAKDVLKNGSFYDICIREDGYL